jgi:trimeric autotransporter adhesin
MAHKARNSWVTETLLVSACSLMLATTSVAATCPFDSGGSDAMNDGVVLTRYALGITGAPLTASTRYASLDPLQVKNNIECVGCALDINGDSQIDTVDTTIIARHLVGFKDASLTSGLALGAGSRNTTAAVTSFLANGCAVGGAINAFVQGGNAFGAPAMLGTTDGQPLTVGVGGGDGLRVARRTDPAQGTAVNVINGVAANTVSKTCPPLPGGLACVVSPDTVVGGTVSGGGLPSGPNRVTDSHSTVAGGRGNVAGNDNGDPNDATDATVGGGSYNTAGNRHSTVAGGAGNTANASFSTISGGTGNLASGLYSTVSGGISSTSAGFASTVSGGSNNRATGDAATVAGGAANLANGNRSFAAGHDAIASGSECAIFGLWSTSNVNYGCNGLSNTFFVGADRGFFVDFNTQDLGGRGTNFISLGNFTAGRVINTGSTAHLTFSGVWTNASDRSLKENSRSINAKSVLQKVLALPVTTWNYITEGNGTRRMGPMAQDFYAAFRLGSDDKTIGTVDAHGVALAAIQGLNQKLGDEVKAKNAEIAALKSRLLAIERRLGAR